MKISDLINNLFLETDSIKMNHLIINYLKGKKLELQAIDDAVNLLDSPLTNCIDRCSLNNREDIALAICRILYTAGLWGSLCDFYFMLYIVPWQKELEIERKVKSTDERELIVRYAYNGIVVRMTVDDSRTVIRLKITIIEEVRF